MASLSSFFKSCALYSLPCYSLSGLLLICRIMICFCAPLFSTPASSSLLRLSPTTDCSDLLGGGGERGRKRGKRRRIIRHEWGRDEWLCVSAYTTPCVLRCVWVCVCDLKKRRKDDGAGVSKKREREREGRRKRGERVLMHFSLSVDWTCAWVTADSSWERERDRKRERARERREGGKPALKHLLLSDLLFFSSSSPENLLRFVPKVHSS